MWKEITISKQNQKEIICYITNTRNNMNTLLQFIREKLLPQRDFCRIKDSQNS